MTLILLCLVFSGFKPVWWGWLIAIALDIYKDYRLVLAHKQIVSSMYIIAGAMDQRYVTYNKGEETPFDNIMPPSKPIKKSN